MTEAERLRNKVYSLELAIELEQVIVDYLQPTVDNWRAGNHVERTGYYLHQSSTSKSSIRGWQQELADYKQLLLIAEMTNESRSKTGESST